MKTVITCVLYSFLLGAGKIASAQTTWPQTGKGKQLIGTNVGGIIIPTKQSGQLRIDLAPVYGLFVSNGLAVGLSVPYYYFDNLGYQGYSLKVTQAGIAPFVRYYVGAKKVRPFMSGAVGFMRTLAKEQGKLSYSDNVVLPSFGAGLAFFMGKVVSLDLGGSYTINQKNYDTVMDIPQNPLNLTGPDAVTIRLGFQYYF